MSDILRIGCFYGSYSPFNLIVKDEEPFGKLIEDDIFNPDDIWGTDDDGDDDEDPFDIYGGIAS